MKEQAHLRHENITLILATEMLRSFGELRSVVRGASMVPSIFPGDTLIIRPEIARGARRGDVVFFFRDGHFCAHRLLDKTEEGGGRIVLLTRGDARRENDPPVAESEMLGRVEAVIRGRKRIEFRRYPAATNRLLRWAVERSTGAVKWLLRWHFFRLRLSRNWGAICSAIRWQRLESM
jgi:hypothetical protein